ncbi:MAG: gliding motility-associated C-terminal domain-containing protein, partial [Chitinophagales bacterium]|nr:gliding motility-associated C-terminal domain-containing protein [Chitinophagales bacterium]
DDPVLAPIDDICETEDIPALSGTTEPYTTINWFDANDNLVGIGSPVTPASLNVGENCFYAVAVHDTIPGLMGDTVSVCFNVDSLPNNVYAGPDDTICGFQDYELQATGDGQLNAWTQLVGPTVSLDFDNPNAVVNLQPQGGTGQSNIYTFVWTNQNGLCSVSDTVVLTVTQPHITNAGNDTTICLPQFGGSVQLDATLSPLGTGYWVYNGAGNIAFADSTDPQTTVSGLIPYVNPTSTYRFYWYEVIGDCVARDEVLVTVNESAEIVGLADADTNCLHSDYVLTAEVTAVNTPGYSWRINSPTGVVVSENMDGVVSPTVNTTYYIVATTVFGENICRSIDSITINVDGYPSVVDDGCYDLLEDESFTGNTSDWAANDDYAAVLTGEVAYEVVSSSIFDYPSTLEIDNTTGTFTFTPYQDMSGADTATVIAYNVACPELTATFTVCFNIEGVPDEPINANNDTTTAIAQTPVDISLFDNDDLNPNAVSSNTTIITDPAHGTVTVTDSENGIVNYVSDDEYARVDSFQYVVCQTLTDGEVLCDSAWVYVYVDGDIFIPEGFTPNGDGTNDAFVIPDLDRLYPNATLKVFNRWGDEVWNSEGPYRNNFVGRTFKGNQLPDGTYFYILQLNNGSGRNMASYVVIYR